MVFSFGICSVLNHQEDFNRLETCVEGSCDDLTKLEETIAGVKPLFLSKLFQDLEEAEKVCKEENGLNVVRVRPPHLQVSDIVRFVLK